VNRTPRARLGIPTFHSSGYFLYGIHIAIRRVLDVGILGRLRLIRRRFRVRMFGAGRQRRIPRRFLDRGDLVFQRGDALLEMIDHRLQQSLKLRRQGGQLLGRNRQLRHAHDVADFANCAKPNFRSQLRRGVNSYDRHESL